MHSVLFIIQLSMEGPLFSKLASTVLRYSSAQGIINSTHCSLLLILTLWSTVSFDKLIFAQLLNKFLVFCADKICNHDLNGMPYVSLTSDFIPSGFLIKTVYILLTLYSGSLTHITFFLFYHLSDIRRQIIKVIMQYCSSCCYYFSSLP
jgi:hypothetical protein